MIDMKAMEEALEDMEEALTEIIFWWTPEELIEGEEMPFWAID